MQKIILAVAFILLHRCIVAQTGTFYNNGSVLQINSGAVVQVNGDFVNAATSICINNGTVNILGNFTNNQSMSLPYSGMLKFNGIAKQYIFGNEILLAKNVTINNAQGVQLNNVLKIDGLINFMSGIVSANDNTDPMVFTSNGNISTTNVAKNISHIKGYVVKEGTGAFTYPVGDSIRYQPVSVNITSNQYGLQVVYDTLDAGTAPFTNNGSESTPLIAYNKLEYWNFTPFGIVDASVTIFWDDYKNAGIVNIADLKVAHLHNNNEWINEGTIGIGNPTSGSITSSSINSNSNFGPFTLGSIANSTLPLHLLSFTGSKQTNHNQLQWKTADETNTKEFGLERSTDGRSFNSFATVAAKGTGNGSYSYDDNAQLSGKVFYRLKMIDNDGRFTYSNIIVLSNQSTTTVSVYPNPVANKATLQFSDNKLLNTTAKLTDMNGRQVSTIAIKNNFEIIDMGKLPAGIYMLQLADGMVQKIVKE
jgi:hypothetical protein